MTWTLAGQPPPTSPWGLPQEVTALVQTWQGWALFIGIGFVILVVIGIGSLAALDKNRGEPVSARAIQVTAVMVVLGLAIMVSAPELANMFT